jgi:hypothetical protein
MTSYSRGRRPSWSDTDARPAWHGLLLVAGIVVAVLLGEVWQSSRVAELSLRLDRNRAPLQAARARVQSLRALAEREQPRKELDEMAAQLGLRPATPEQTILLPGDYLAVNETAPDKDVPPIERFAERVARAIVPDARALTRSPH